MKTKIFCLIFALAVLFQSGVSAQAQIRRDEKQCYVYLMDETQFRGLTHESGNRYTLKGVSSVPGTAILQWGVVCTDELIRKWDREYHYTEQGIRMLISHSFENFRWDGHQWIGDHTFILANFLR